MKFSFRFISIWGILLLCCISTSAKPKAPGVPLVCDTVLQAPDLNADQIYDNFKIWFANKMRSANDVIQLEDPDKKHIIGKSGFAFNVDNMTWHCLTGVIRFTIEIAARDGRYRLKIHDFYHQAFRDGWSEGPVFVGGPNPAVKGLRKKQNSEMQKRAIGVCAKNIADIIVSLQETMLGKASVTTDDDW